MPKLTQPINPPSLVKPAGYAHGWEAQGGKTVSEEWVWRKVG